MTPRSAPVGRTPPSPVSSLTAYELAHLAAHLAAAGREADLHGLLALEWPQPSPAGRARARARNAWYEAKTDVGDTAGWLDDVDRAWRLAASPEPTGDESADAARTGYQCRYALLASSFNSLAANTPAALLAALVTSGVWSIQRATAYGRRTPDPAERVKRLVALLPVSDPQGRDAIGNDLLAAIPAIDRAAARADALEQVIRAGPEGLRRAAFAMALDFARSATTPYDWSHGARTLSQSSDSMPEDVARAAVQVWQQRGEAAPMCLVRRLPDADRAPLLASAFAPRHVGSLSEADLFDLILDLEVGGDQLPPRVRHAIASEALQATLRLPDASTRTEYLLDLLPSLGGRGDRQRACRAIVDDLTDKATVGTFHDVQQQALLRLASHDWARSSVDLVGIARLIPDAIARVTASAALLPHVSKRARAELTGAIVSAMRAPRADEWLAEIAEDIAPHLPASRLGEAVGAVRGGWKGGPRVRALTAFAARRKGATRDRLVREIVGRLNTDPRLADERPNTIGRLAPIASAATLGELLAIAATIGDAAACLDALPSLFRALPRGDRARAWALAMRATAGSECTARRADIIAAMAPSLPRTLRASARQTAIAFEDPQLVARALLALAAHVSPPERESILVEVHAALGRLSRTSPSDRTARARLLVELAAVDHERRADTIETLAAELATIGDIEACAPILAHLSRVLPGPRADEMVLEALRAPAPSGRGRGVMEALAPHLPRSAVLDLLVSLRRRYLPPQQRHQLHRQHANGLTLGFVLDDEDDVYVGLLRRLAKLGDALLAWDIVCERPRDGVWPVAAAAVLPGLPAALVVEIVPAVLRLTDGDFGRVQIVKRDPDDRGKTMTTGAAAREYTLAAICPELARAGDSPSAIDLAQSLKDPGWRAEALVGVATYLEEPALPSAAENAVRDLELSSPHTCSRRVLIGDLAERLAVLPVRARHPIVTMMLRAWAAHTRARAVEEISALVPALTAERDGISARAVLRALEDVLRWWM
jgi:hypothetical protein